MIATRILNLAMDELLENGINPYTGQAVERFFKDINCYIEASKARTELEKPKQLPPTKPNESHTCKKMKRWLAYTSKKKNRTTGHPAKT